MRIASEREIENTQIVDLLMNRQSRIILDPATADRSLLAPGIAR